MNFLFLSPLFPEHPHISVCCPCSRLLAPFHVTARRTLPAVAKYELCKRLSSPEGRWLAVRARGTEWADREARPLVSLSAWESLPADVCGTNGMTPPMPAGTRLRGKVPPVFVRLRRRPGTSEEKRLGRDGVWRLAGGNASKCRAHCEWSVISMVWEWSVPEKLKSC